MLLENSRKLDAREKLVIYSMLGQQELER